jgi:hypothetical protein
MNPIVKQQSKDNKLQYNTCPHKIECDHRDIEHYMTLKHTEFALCIFIGRVQIDLLKQSKKLREDSVILEKQIKEKNDKIKILEKQFEKDMTEIVTSVRTIKDHRQKLSDIINNLDKEIEDAYKNIRNKCPIVEENIIDNKDNIKEPSLDSTVNKYIGSQCDLSKQIFHNFIDGGEIIFCTKCGTMAEKPIVSI